MSGYTYILHVVEAVSCEISDARILAREAVVETDIVVVELGGEVTETDLHGGLYTCTSVCV